MTEGSDDTVIVRSAPFAKEIRQPVHHYLRAGSLRMDKDFFFTGFLTDAVGVIALCLGRGRDDDGAGVLMLLYLFQDFAGKSSIAQVKIAFILGAVDPGQMEYEVALPG